MKPKYPDAYVLIIGLESGSPVPVLDDVPVPNFDDGKSSQESLLTEGASVAATRKVPLVDLAGSPTSKRRQPSSVSSRRTPRQPDQTPGFRTNDSDVWMPSSAPSKLANGLRQRHGGGSPSESAEREVAASLPWTKGPSAFDGELSHRRVAALQSRGPTRVSLQSSCS